MTRKWQLPSECGLTVQNIAIHRFPVNGGEIWQIKKKKKSQKKKIIMKGTVLRRRAKISWFIEPNAKDVHFIGASVLPLPIVSSTKDRKRSKIFIFRIFDFVRVIPNE